MFAVSDVAPNAPTNGPSQTQNDVIASVIAMQKVIAGQRGGESGGTSDQNARSGSENPNLLRPYKSAAQRNADANRASQGQPDPSAEARSIVEAQEASELEATLNAAFMARHELKDLLSVIRDPEDRMIPQAPDDTSPPVQRPRTDVSA